MKKRPSLTIVVVTARRLIRADFDARMDDGPSQLWSRSQGTGGDLPDDVAEALALGPPSLSQVLVLCEACWCQSVKLPASQTQGLSPVETAQALQFEVEPFSNMAPGAGMIGYRAAAAVDGVRPYWVVECGRVEMAAIRDAVRRAGGRLAGVSHPGGVPAPLGEGDPARPWHRLEQWERGLLLVRAADGKGGRSEGVGVQNTTPAQLDANRLPPAEYGETLARDADGAAALVAAGQPAPVRVLADEAELRRWLRAWAHCLTRAPDALAIIVPPPVNVPLRRLVLAGVALEALAAIFCLAHAGWLSAQRQRLRRELAAARASGAEAERIEKENAATALAVEELGRLRGEGDRYGRMLAQRRHALPVLLRALAQARPDGVVIQELRDEGGWSLQIAGMGVTADAADELIARLTGALKDTGWQVQPLLKAAQGGFDHAGPWRFAFRAVLSDSLTATVAAWAPATAEGVEP